MPSPPAPPPSSPPSNRASSSSSTHHAQLHFRHSLAHGPPTVNSTPFPHRKPLQNSAYHNLTAPSRHRAVSAPPERHHSKLITPSARKLAVSLWEYHGTPIPSEPAAHSRTLCQQADSAEVNSVHKYFHPQVSPGPGSESGFINKTRKPTDASQASTQVITVIRPISGTDSGLSQAKKTCGLPRRAKALNHDITLSSKPQLAESSGMASPKYFVKVLNRIKTLEEQQNTNMSVVAALRVELERARTRVQELEFAQKLASKEFDNLLNRITEENALLREEEQERMNSAVMSMREELEREREAKRRLEMRNMKLSKNLSRTNKALRRAVFGLEKERKSRELMEDVCDELAKEIAKDKTEMEELKQGIAGVREEVEEERKMLQIAEVWREERVQMKLEEARLDLEERRQAVETLRSELEGFLKSRCSKDEDKALGDAREAEMLQNAAAHFLVDQSD